MIIIGWGTMMSGSLGGREEGEKRQIEKEEASNKCINHFKCSQKAAFKSSAKK